jgi:sulfate permease, SulP family
MSDSPSTPPAPAAAPPAVAKASFLSRSMPGLRLFTPGSLRGIRYDLMAAITLAAYLLPAGLGDASLAQLPPEAGLYACLFSGLVFWFFCSSRHTTVTVTSAISLLIGSSLGELAHGDADRFYALAACTAILVGIISFIAWLVRAGVVVNFISETVLLGFKTGVALHLASTQLPKLFGFKGTHGSFWERIGYFFEHLSQTNVVALLVGGCALLLLLAGKQFLKNKPVALFVMIAGIALTSVAHLDAQGVKLLGKIPQGIPMPGLPAIDLADLNDLLPLAMACFLLSAVETVAIGRTFALKHGYRLDANQEFLALAAGNLAAGFGHGYPVGGGMSQSLVNESAGARTPLSGLLAAGIIIVVAVFLSGLLRNLPETVLAAIVLSAVTGLVKIPALKHLWHFSRNEFAIAMVALAGVLTSGLLRGVLIGAVISVLMLLRRGARPPTTELGRIAGTDYFADAIRHPENLRAPGVFVFRVDSGIFYFNIDHIRDRFTELLNQRPDPIQLAIFFLGTTPIVDLAGAELLIELHDTLKERNIAFRVAEARGPVRDALRRAGFESRCGELSANQTVAQIIAGSHGSA